MFSKHFCRKEDGGRGICWTNPLYLHLVGGMEKGWSRTKRGFRFPLYLQKATEKGKNVSRRLGNVSGLSLGSWSLLLPGNQENNFNPCTPVSSGFLPVSLTVEMKTLNTSVNSPEGPRWWNIGIGVSVSSLSSFLLLGLVLVWGR